jgi:hypothetical protein
VGGRSAVIDVSAASAAIADRAVIAESAAIADSRKRKRLRDSSGSLILVFGWLGRAVDDSVQ